MKSRRKLERLEQAARQTKLDQIEAELRDLQENPPTLEILEEFKTWMPQKVFNDLFGDQYQRLIAGK